MRRHSAKDGYEVPERRISGVAPRSLRIMRGKLSRRILLMATSFRDRVLKHLYSPWALCRRLTTCLCETLRRAFRNASNVESQESCVHPILGDTAGARPLLRCSPLLSRQNKGAEYYRQKYAHKYAREQRPSDSTSQRIHVQPPTNTIQFPKAITARGAKDPFWDTGSSWLV
jgi:hypothetical protein